MGLTPKETVYGTSKNILANDHFKVLPEGRTIDSSLIVADADGVKTAVAGLVVGQIAATKKIGPYDAAAVDGREVALGILIDDTIVTDGDDGASVLIHGFVREQMLTGLDAAAKTALKLIYFLP